MFFGEIILDATSMLRLVTYRQTPLMQLNNASGSLLYMPYRVIGSSEEQNCEQDPGCGWKPLPSMVASESR